MAEKIKNMNLGITVDDGSRRVPINNIQGEEIGVFYFHPTDMGIIERYNKLVDKFDAITEPLNNLSVADDATDEKQLAALKEAETRLYSAVNELFATDAADAFFGSMHPFSPVNGVFYCEAVLQAVGEYISAQFDAETARFSERVNKYTKGVKKK